MRTWPRANVSNKLWSKDWWNAAAYENRSLYTLCWENREGVHIYNLEFADRWESKTRNCGAAELAETHPSPEDNTSADAAPRQIRPPQSACAGKSPHRASRNSYSPACTCGRSEAPCSQSAEGGNEVDGCFKFHCNKQFRQNWNLTGQPCWKYQLTAA